VGGCSERACRVAAHGVFLAARAIGPGHVLFTVTHDRSLGTYEGVAGAAAAFRRVIGIGSIPEPLRSAVSEQLSRDAAPSASESPSATYVLHGRPRPGGGGGVAATAPAPPAPSAWRGHDRAIAVAAALGGHLGVARDTGRGFTRLWLLLPRTPLARGRRDSAGVISVSLLQSLGIGRSMRDIAPQAASTARYGMRAIAPAAAAATSVATEGAPALAAAASRSPWPVADERPAVLLSPVSAPRSPYDPPDRPPHVAGAHASPARRTASSRRMSPRRVLLVDDEAVLRRLVGRMLDRLGVAYEALEDGAEVAGALTPEHDLILLDIVMKHSDGVQVRAGG
jgi:hypothetical protein